MAAADKSKPLEEVVPDLLPAIRNSGILADRQFTDLRARVQAGAYPSESRALARRLVQDGVLTEFQAGRLLGNKSQGLMVGRYVILDRIGSGSMGRVYKAHHPLMGRVVALKIIAPEISQNARVVARFQREIKLVGRLDHPNVVRAFDADQVGSMLYIVMEYVKGESLGRLLRTRGVFPPGEVAAYGAQAALGLAHAHAQGIVHRDIKPSNLFLSHEGQLKVLDLGLGALMEADEEATFATADGIAVGTVDYMSPEQATGRDVDGRSDLFSLGCTMYHLVTGRIPFPGDSPIDRLGRRLSGRPVPVLESRADVPGSLVKVLDRLMANHPAARYQSAEEVADALTALRRRPSRSASRIPTPAAEVALPPPTPPPPEPEPYVVTVAAAGPDFPAWFRPLARLATHAPAAALVALLGGLVAAFGAGFGLAWLLKSH